ncbi:MAG: groES [candidate division WS6 bacterium 34_10]|uniref:10 kDa chaperonin n=1 Tax=candidate division WS6 bacterium 34_10 TaxID=1641389 RepID=A0A124FWS4_9BACT|nr:MAG: groES [candidate division WS6 bacterium 34_10]
MADIKIQPLGNRILVRPQEEEETIAGGLVIPPSANDDKQYLIVDAEDILAIIK